MFTDTEFMTATEKEKVLKQWRKFIHAIVAGESGDRLYGMFTKRLYDHLIQHCSFIAHYNMEGFFRVYFDPLQNAEPFIRQFDSGVSTEYGMTYWLRGNYQDINEAMCEVVRPVASSIYESCKTEECKKDIATAKALLAKHGISIGEKL